MHYLNVQERFREELPIVIGLEGNCLIQIGDRKHAEAALALQASSNSMGFLHNPNTFLSVLFNQSGTIKMPCLLILF